MQGYAHAVVVASLRIEWFRGKCIPSLRRNPKAPAAAAAGASSYLIHQA